MRKKINLFLALLLLATQAHAVCPVCTIAAIAGVGILRFLGVSDLITGMWVGALIVSSSLWLADWLSKKNKKFRHMELTITILMYAIYIIPMYSAGLMNNPGERFFGMDDLLFGIAVGSVVFIAGVAFDKYLRSINSGKAAFFYQKVVIPISAITVASIAAELILLIYS